MNSGLSFMLAKRVRALDVGGVRHLNCHSIVTPFQTPASLFSAALRKDIDAAVTAAIASPLTEAASAALANAWAERIAALQVLLNDSSRFLAAFDVRFARARAFSRMRREP